MRFLIFAVLIIFISCENRSQVAQIDKLVGYWEIESVAMPDGTIKEFSASTIIDYIEITENNGVRSKISPQLDGSFKKNGKAEKFTIKIESDSLRLYYETPFDSWKETVLTATDGVLKVLNRDGKVYHYTKFKKLNFTE